MKRTVTEDCSLHILLTFLLFPESHPEGPFPNPWLFAATTAAAVPEAQARSTGHCEPHARGAEGLVLWPFWQPCRRRLLLQSLRHWEEQGYLSEEDEGACSSFPSPWCMLSWHNYGRFLLQRKLTQNFGLQSQSFNILVHYGVHYRVLLQRRPIAQNGGFHELGTNPSLSFLFPPHSLKVNFKTGVLGW